MKVGTSFQRNVFFQGLKEGIPLTFYFVVVFLAVGAAYRAAGIGGFLGVFATFWVYSAPAQLATVDFLSGGAWASLLAATVIINARFMFMAAALLPHFRDQKKLTLLAACQFVSATSFSLTFTHYKTHPKSHAFSYFLGVVLIGSSTACLATYAGAASVEQIPENALPLLQMILPIFFTYSIAGAWPQSKFVLAGILGFVFAPLTEYWIPESGLLLASLMSGLLVFWVDKHLEKRKGQ